MFTYHFCAFIHSAWGFNCKYKLTGRFFQPWKYPPKILTFHLEVFSQAAYTCSKSKVFLTIFKYKRQKEASLTHQSVHAWAQGLLWEEVGGNRHPVFHDRCFLWSLGVVGGNCPDRTRLGEGEAGTHLGCHGNHDKVQGLKITPFPVTSMQTISKQFMQSNKWSYLQIIFSNFN